MKTYIDLDGVIFDSERWLFEGYDKLGKTTEEEKIKYIQAKNWAEVLSKSEIINNSIEILKELKNTAILTKIHSMENEGTSKIKILRELGVRNEIILAPYTLKKTDIVDPEGNILVDDTIHNLDDWKMCRGIPIYFNMNNTDIDGWGNINKDYIKIKSLDYLKRFN